VGEVNATVHPGVQVLVTGQLVTRIALNRLVEFRKLRDGIVHALT
jgi:hypothetical protein